MKKPSIVIADTDLSYVFPLQNFFVKEFFEKVDIEIISDKDYFEEVFSTIHPADILIISEELYDSSLQRHNIPHIFKMMEQYEENFTAELSVNCIYKYTSPKEIFNEIIAIGADSLKIKENVNKETEIIMFYSALGGTGKTTLSMGISASLIKNHKKVLYLNASHLQTFQYMLENQAPIAGMDVYAKLSNPKDTIYQDIKHVIRNEIFSYLPPFKSSLMSLGLQYDLFMKIIESVKKSKDYDYIVVDCDITFDEDKASLLSVADKVIIVTERTEAAIFATNVLVSNINGINSDKYIFVCNKFNSDNDHISNIELKYTISEYVETFNNSQVLGIDELLKDSGINKISFLIS